MKREKNREMINTIHCVGLSLNLYICINSSYWNKCNKRGISHELCFTKSLHVSIYITPYCSISPPHIIAVDEVFLVHYKYKILIYILLCIYRSCHCTQETIPETWRGQVRSVPSHELATTIPWSCQSGTVLPTEQHSAIRLCWHWWATILPV